MMNTKTEIKRLKEILNRLEKMSTLPEMDEELKQKIKDYKEKVIGHIKEIT